MNYPSNCLGNSRYLTISSGSRHLALCVPVSIPLSLSFLLSGPLFLSLVYSSAVSHTLESRSVSRNLHTLHKHTATPTYKQHTSRTQSAPFKYIYQYMHISTHTHVHAHKLSRTHAQFVSSSRPEKKTRRRIIIKT